MTTLKPAQPLSHVEIADLITRFALQRLEGDASVDPVRFAEFIARLIEEGREA